MKRGLYSPKWKRTVLESARFWCDAKRELWCEEITQGRMRGLWEVKGWCVEGDGCFSVVKRGLSQGLAESVVQEWNAGLAK